MSCMSHHGSAHTATYRAVEPEYGRHAKVRDLDVVVIVEKDVLGFEVPVRDAQLVQILLGAENR